MTISVKAYARHRATKGLPGTTAKAVRNARDSGRLVGALTPDGQIISAERADACWEAHTRDDRRPLAATKSARAEPVAELPTDVPPLAVSRARREAALAEIAEADARSKTGGRWLPISQVEEIEADYRADIARATRLLRERLPPAVHRRIDLQHLAKLCAAIGAQTKHRCGEPMAPLSYEPSVFRVAMHEVENAVDEVLTEVADLLEREDDADDEDGEDEG